MNLRVDVSDLHALIAVICGGASIVFTTGCLVGGISDRNNVAPIAIGGAIAVGLWCGLFALVLRGTIVTRVAAALGIVAACLAFGVGSCAAAIHW